MPMHCLLLLPIASLKRNPPLKWNFSMTGNLRCFNYIELTLRYKDAVVKLPTSKGKTYQLDYENGKLR